VVAGREDGYEEGVWGGREDGVEFGWGMYKGVSVVVGVGGCWLVKKRELGRGGKGFLFIEKGVEDTEHL